ncbi:hypothetical protein BJ165DRAFT_1525905 [Panaeolus papilionaceus]|nr:hypothetical protein BJ165DRAFT_1525905 [Panaeolus papilionaceus]
MTHCTSKQRVNIANMVQQFHNFGNIILRPSYIQSCFSHLYPSNFSLHMRQSVAANRISHAPSTGAGMSSAAAQAKLLEKKKEYDAVAALERASALYLERIEALGADCDIMANAGEGTPRPLVDLIYHLIIPVRMRSHSSQVHGQVLSQWPKMFQILTTFLESRESFNHEGQDPEAPISQGQKLVRVPIEELQQAQADKS